ncbi:hypothetical protein CEB3_c05390 [Peptococcaceae bacterium CEB3]|nr:hypothetical protein CEB3_c05390 [Peptococcaceae bacterium CEB3]
MRNIFNWPVEFLTSSHYFGAALGTVRFFRAEMIQDKVLVDVFLWLDILLLFVPSIIWIYTTRRLVKWIIAAVVLIVLVAQLVSNEPVLKKVSLILFSVRLFMSLYFRCMPGWYEGI